MMCKSKTDNAMSKRKRANNDLQNTTQEDCATPPPPPPPPKKTPQKPGVKSGAPEGISSSSSISCYFCYKPSNKS